MKRKRELVSIQSATENLALRIELLLAKDSLSEGERRELIAARNFLKKASLALATVAL